MCRNTSLLTICLFLLPVKFAHAAEGDLAKDQVKQETIKQQKQGELIPLQATGQVQDVCAGSVPAGWIKVNDRWDPMACGKPSSIIYNVWTIERYSDKPVGSVMNTCFGTPPSG